MNKNISVLQIGRYFPPHIGGTENVMRDLTEGLNKEGIKCDVLCCNDTNKYEETELPGYKVMRTKTNWKVGSIAISFQQIMKLKSIWRNYDIIHLHHPAPMATLAVLLINPSCKVVVYWHSDIVRQKILLLFFKPFQNLLLKLSSAVVATNPKYITGSNALQKYPLKTTYIPIGISPLTPLGPADLALLKSKYAEKKIIFSLGRLVEYKGFKYLVDAATHLPPDYLILIGGEGRLRPALQKQIAENSLEDKVKLLGKLSDNELAGYYNICDLFCLPSISKNEAFGLVLAEAMSFSKPIVATNIPGSGVPWVNEHEVTGLNVEVENAVELANSIKMILSNPALARKYGEAAFRRYSDIFKKESMTNSFIKLYNSVISPN